MTEYVYNRLLPHKAYIDAMYKSIGTHNTFESTPVLNNILAEAYLLEPERKPIDWGCSACAREAMRVAIIDFVNYHNTK